MSRICQLTSEKVMVGNNVSHSTITAPLLPQPVQEAFLHSRRGPLGHPACERFRYPQHQPPRRPRRHQQGQGEAPDEPDSALSPMKARQTAGLFCVGLTNFGNRPVVAEDDGQAIVSAADYDHFVGAFRQFLGGSMPFQRRSSSEMPSETMSWKSRMPSASMRFRSASWIPFRGGTRTEALFLLELAQWLVRGSGEADVADQTSLSE